MIIKVNNPPRDYLIKHAKEVKATDGLYYRKRARQSAELKIAQNCKLTVEKKLTRNQQIVYSSQIERDKLKKRKQKIKNKKNTDDKKDNLKKKPQKIRNESFKKKRLLKVTETNDDKRKN